MGALRNRSSDKRELNQLGSLNLKDSSDENKIHRDRDFRVENDLNRVLKSTDYVLLYVKLLGL